MKRTTIFDVTIGEFQIKELEIHFSREFGKIPLEKLSGQKNIFTDGNIIEDPSAPFNKPQAVVADFSYLVFGNLDTKKTVLHIILSSKAKPDVLENVPIFTPELVAAIAC